MVTQEDVELAEQEVMMNMARLNRTNAGFTHIAKPTLPPTSRGFGILGHHRT